MALYHLQHATSCSTTFVYMMECSCPYLEWCDEFDIHLLYVLWRCGPLLTYLVGPGYFGYFVALPANVDYIFSSNCGLCSHFHSSPPFSADDTYYGNIPLFHVITLTSCLLLRTFISNLLPCSNNPFHSTRMSKLSIHSQRPNYVHRIQSLDMPRSLSC